MQLTLEQYERIQNYLDGMMAPPEQKEFLNELRQNPFLNDSFEFEKELRQNLTSLLDRKNLFEKYSSYNEEDTAFENAALIRSLIKDAGNGWQDVNTRSSSGVVGESADIPAKRKVSKTKPISMRPWIIATAAACIIIAIVSLKRFTPGSPLTPPIAQTNDISNVKKYSAPGTVITVPDDTTKKIKAPVSKIDYIALFRKYHSKDLSTPVMPDLLAMVPDDYKNGDYSFRHIDLNNQPHFRGSTKDVNSPQNILQLGHYYKGLSFIETNNNKQAIEDLQWVIDNAFSRQLKIKAQWYLALIYLKEANITNTIPLLSALSTNSKAIPYNKKAGEILEALKNKREQ